MRFFNISPLAALGGCVAAAAATIAAPAAHAQIIDFEGFAQSGGVTNIGPTTPYTEAGFTLTPLNEESGVFDLAEETDFFGRSDSDFFGFADSNLITLTQNGGGSFNFTSVILGPISYAQQLPISITIVGNLAGGGTVTQTFSGLNTATTATLNFTNVSSVTFRTTDDAGLDNIVVGSANAAPEPATLALLATGLLPVAGAVIRRRRSKA